MPTTYTNAIKKTILTVMLACCFSLAVTVELMAQKNTQKTSPKKNITLKKNIAAKNIKAKAKDNSEQQMLWPPVLWPEEGYTLHHLLAKNSEPNASNSEPVILIIGGIQGDEPGGFSAASLLVTNYTIKKGQLWVIPSLNFNSMINRNRGLYGDMNRKFSAIAKDDPDVKIISRIKDIISDPRVSLVLNLHDGSGFYHPENKGPRRNPSRWGQSLIIDQAAINTNVSTTVSDTTQVNLEQIGEKVLSDANKQLVSPDHQLFLHNTHTAKGNKEMEKTLSYFAVLKGKAAFGLEASKDFTTEYRAYYHLLMIESFLKQNGVEFERNFALSPAGVLKALNNDVSLAMWENKVVLPLDNVRKSINTVPMKKNTELSAKPSKPIMTVVKGASGYQVLYGNRVLTNVKPMFTEFDNSLENIKLLVDGKEQQANFGSIIKVNSNFSVHEIKGFRVNAIGVQKGDPARNNCESNINIVKKDFIESYSVDNSANIYRVEIYKDKAFAGMVLVEFGKHSSEPRTAEASNPKTAQSEALTEQKGQESNLGF